MKIFDTHRERVLYALAALGCALGFVVVGLGSFEFADALDARERAAVVSLARAGR